MELSMLSSSLWLKTFWGHSNVKVNPDSVTSYCFKLFASVCLYNTYSDIQRLSSENPAFLPSLNHSYSEFLLKHNFCRQFLNTGFNTLEFIKIVICCHSQYYDWDNYASHDTYEVQPWRWLNISESLPIIRKKEKLKAKEKSKDIPIWMQSSKE